MSRKKQKKYKKIYNYLNIRQGQIVIPVLISKMIFRVGFDQATAQ